MSHNLTKEKAEKFAEEMFELGSTYPEIRQSLITQGHSASEAEQILQPLFFKNLEKSIRKQKILSTVLLVVIISLVTLYLYGNNQNKEKAMARIADGSAPLHNGNYVVVGNFQNYEFLMKLAVWLTIALFFIVIRLLFNRRTLKRKPERL